MDKGRTRGGGAGTAGRTAAVTVVYRCDECGAVEDAVIASSVFNSLQNKVAIKLEVSQATTGPAKHLCERCRRAAVLGYLGVDDPLHPEWP